MWLDVRPMTDQGKRTTAEMFQQVWSQALVTVSNAEDEVSRLVARLQERAGWSPEDAKRQIRELSERLVGQRREVEKRVEDVSQRTLGRLRIPRRDQVAQLNTRLAALEKRLEALDK